MLARCLFLVAFIVLACAASARAEPLQWASEPVPIDNLRPGGGRDITEVSCPSPSFCAAVDARGNALVSHDPEGGTDAWSSTPVLNDQWVLMDVDCPTSSLCVAVGDNGSIATTTDPDSGNWNAVRVGSERLGMVECPTTTLCVASTFSGGVYTSTAPTGGAADWHRLGAPAPEGLNTLSCPAANLCVAAAGTGVWTSTDPANAASWSFTQIAWNGYAEWISCGSPTLCVVGGSSGMYARSTNPTGGAAEWPVASFGKDAYHRVVCATSTLCVANEIGGSTIYVSINGGANWTPQSHTPMTPLTCAGADLCVATDFNPRGAILLSSDPVQGDWERTDFDRLGVKALGGVACPSASLCLAVDEAGRVLASADPRGAAQAWHEEADLSGLGAGALLVIACPTTGFCVAGDDDGGLFVRQSGWRRSRPGTGTAVNAVGCASPAFCVAADDGGRILRSTGGGWELVRPADGQPLYGVACPSTALCVAVGASGAPLVSTDGAATWSARQISVSNTPLFGVTCPTGDLCMAADELGLGLLSLSPASDWSWWQGPDLDVDPLTAITCPSPSLCVMADAAGRTFASNDPAGTRPAWIQGPTASAVPAALACSGDAVCVMVDEDGFAWTATGTGVPFNTVAPAITGTTTPGGTVRCSPGEWSHAPASLRYQWERTGREIAGATSDTYTTSGAGPLTCRVTASNSAGDATARTTVAITFARPPRPPRQPTLSPPQPIRVAFSASIRASHPHLASLRRSGLPVTVTCSTACTISLRLILSSRALGRKRGATIGTARAQLARAGHVTVRLRLTASAWRALARAHLKRLVLVLSATEPLRRPVTGGGTLTLRR
jgi:hypothetical protein